MPVSKIFTHAILAIGLIGGLGLPSHGAEPHSHGAAPSQNTELRLNKATTWKTDATFKKGMTGIRADVAASLDRIHAGTLSADGYKALADRLQQHIDFIVGQCHLAPEVDEQAHVLLERMIDGMADMGNAQTAMSGAVQVVQALAVYPKYFDHPGWTPLAH